MLISEIIIIRLKMFKLYKDFSIVTLITDPGHALLAVNTRTEKRVMVSGTGDNRYLKAEYMSLNEDVIEGDHPASLSNLCDFA